jgi:DNA-binding response OmpR family regulator
MRILLVGDVPEEREAYAQAFRQSGYCTLQAGNPADACRLASELPPAAVVVDLELSPPEDGVALIRELQRDLPLSTPAVILIARALTGEREAFVRSRCDLLVLKPCMADELTAIVDGLVPAGRPS